MHRLRSIRIGSSVTRTRNGRRQHSMLISLGVPRASGLRRSSDLPLSETTTIIERGASKMAIFSASDANGILKGKYPAKEHAKKVIEYLRSHGAGPEGVIYLEAQKTHMIEDNDTAAHFRQRRYFFYLTGCELPDSYVIYDIGTGKSTLFIPPIDKDEVIWSGLPTLPDEALAKYDVDAVLPSTEVAPLLASHKAAVYAIANQVSDQVSFLNASSTDFQLLKTAIEESRVVKTPYEIALIRHANEVSAAAHIVLMKEAATATNERELEALFLKECISRGCRNQAYPSIIASGTAAATLHYVKNDAPLEGKLNLLVDAGAEAECYASDITRTFPIRGSFSKESREIYELVLRMQKECIDLLKDGVLWDSVHEHAHKVAIAGLLDLGILKGSQEEIFKQRTSVAFFPHGLGHYLGMDTHDTGGHANYSDTDSMFRYLRVRGKVPAGSVITVEPGVYFCRFIIEPYLSDPVHKDFIDIAVLDRYWDVGGVRIEDNILITQDGYENLTVTPKEVHEMETK